MAHFLASVAFEREGHPAAGSSSGETGTLETHVHGFLTNAPDVSRRLGRPPDATPLDHRGLITAAYHAWGADIQRHLEGEFCLAVVDHGARRVLLTHDGLGLRPIYYALKGRTLHFATRVDAVARAVGASDLDDSFVLGYLARSASHPGPDGVPGRQPRRSGSDTAVGRVDARASTRPGPGRCRAASLSERG